MHGKGRVFYTSMGHREDVWTNPLYQEMLFGGVAWAVRDADADVTPNIKEVAPHCLELPPPPPPAKPK
jgi:type 1 glutamine amidotransferase